MPRSHTQASVAKEMYAIMADRTIAPLERTYVLGKFVDERICDGGKSEKALFSIDKIANKLKSKPHSISSTHIRTAVGLARVAKEIQQDSYYKKLPLEPRRRLLKVTDPDICREIAKQFIVEKVQYHEMIGLIYDRIGKPKKVKKKAASKKKKKKKKAKTAKKVVVEEAVTEKRKPGRPKKKVISPEEEEKKAKIKRKKKRKLVRPKKKTMKSSALWEEEEPEWEPEFDLLDDEDDLDDFDPSLYQKPKKKKKKAKKIKKRFVQVTALVATMKRIAKTDIDLTSDDDRDRKLGVVLKKLAQWADRQYASVTAGKMKRSAPTTSNGVNARRQVERIDGRLYVLQEFDASAPLDSIF